MTLKGNMQHEIKNILLKATILYLKIPQLELI
jgi:hypothetical protein